MEFMWEVTGDSGWRFCQGYSLDLLILLWRISGCGGTKGEEWEESCWRRIVGRELGF